jgi:hypothetical protein
MGCNNSKDKIKQEIEIKKPNTLRSIKVINKPLGGSHAKF